MKNWWRRFNIVLDLPFRDKIFFFKILIYLVLAKIGLLVLPFNHFKKLYQAFSRLPISAKSSAHINQPMLTWAVEAIATNLPFNITCLPKALVTKFLLRKDKDFILKIGVNFENKALKAHAWVEKEGDIIIGSSSIIKYTPIWCW